MIKTMFALCLIFFLSCRVSLVPSYSSSAVTKVSTTSLATDNLYTAMINGDKTFAGNESKYSFISSQIIDILKLDSTRSKPKIILIMMNDIKGRFEKYMQEHKSFGTLNVSQLKTYKDYMQALWESIYNAEINFKS